MSGNPHVDVMLAGAAAAFTVDLLIYPLDTLKTRQQSRDFLQTFADPGKTTRLPSRDLFRGLYQGIGIVIVATLPASGTFFTTYEAAKRLVGQHGAPLGMPQPAVHSVASAMAECASCLVLTPAEVIKQNAQMIQGKSSSKSSSSKSSTRPGSSSPSSSSSSTSASGSSSSLAALKQLSRGQGVSRNLLSGYTALVARNLPFTAIQFPIFEYLRERISRERLFVGRTRRSSSASSKGEEEEEDGSRDGDNRRRKTSLLETGVVSGLSAGLAGSFAAVVTTPMDVVKTRMMLAAGSSGVGDANNESSGSNTSRNSQASLSSSSSSSASSSSSSSSSSSQSKGPSSSSTATADTKQSPRSGLAVTRQVIAERGIVGLFRGSLIRAVWTAVGSGLYLGMYEVSKVWLTGDQKERGSDEGFP